MIKESNSKSRQDLEMAARLLGGNWEMVVLLSQALALT